MRVGRRGFLRTSVLGGGAAALVGCSGTDGATRPETSPSRGDGGDGDNGPDGPEGVEDPAPLAYVGFRGEHQTGITHPTNAQGLLAAFTVTARDRTSLEAMLRTLSKEAQRLMEGEEYEERERAFAPLYTGIVGNPAPPADLSIIVSVGASLFDGR